MKDEYSIKGKRNNTKNNKIKKYCITASILLLISYVGCDTMLKNNKKHEAKIMKDGIVIGNNNYFSKDNYWYTKDIVIPNDKYQIKSTNKKIRVLK